MASSFQNRGFQALWRFTAHHAMDYSVGIDLLAKKDCAECLLHRLHKEGKSDELA